MHVVILGAGLAGLTTAKALSKKRPPHMSITVIDPKTYALVYWASIRALFSRRVAIDSTFPLAPWATAHNVNLIHATATSLNPRSVTLDTGADVPFDVCILATGAVTPVPELGRGPYEAEVEASRARFEADGKRVLEARHVLVVGGGSIGVEFAGDIAGYAAQLGKKAQVTLVHGGGHLVPEMSAAGGEKLKAQLEALGVRVVLGEKAVKQNEGWVLQSGEELDVDEVIVSTGLQVANKYMRAGLDEDGWVRVDEQFRVQGLDGRVFAVGDCCDGHEKTATSAFPNAANVAENVLMTVKALKEERDLRGLTSAMKTESSAPPVFLVLSGPSSGVAKTPLGNITWGLPRLKIKTMFLFRERRRWLFEHADMCIA